jgi:uncharacterized membrane protein
MMRSIKKIGEGILLGGVILLIFLAIFESKIHLPIGLKVVGNMHPVMLHFPIVLMLISFLTIWLPNKYVEDPFFDGLRFTAAFSAVITALMGLFLSLQTNAEGNTLTWHKWGGISLSVVAFVFYHTYHYFANYNLKGKVFTVIATLLLIITSDFGGNLTHGENFIFAPLMQKQPKQVSLEDALVFNDLIKPIFESKCVNCHGMNNQKGGLNLDDSLSIVSGGKTGKLYIPGDPANSLLLKRFHLPADDKKHMPPITKTQLNDDEIKLVTAWVKSGALYNVKVSSLPANDSFRILAAKFINASINTTNIQYDFAAASESTIKELNNNYRVLEPQGLGSPAIAVLFYGRSVYEPKSLEELNKVKKQIVSLSLSHMPVKDDELKTIANFEHLEKLNLNYTDVTNKGVAKLNDLKNIKEVSLSGTAITVEALQQLVTLPSLKKIFIWDTKIDSIQIASLRKKHRNLAFETGYSGDGGMLIELSPPILENTDGVFDNELTIKMKHPLNGAELRYTLDGTLPDSIKGLLYKTPFTIKSNAKLIARAFKKGWVGSMPIRGAYIRRGFNPDEVTLLAPPDAKYTGGGKLLSDADLGDLNFGGGKWLGYMNNPAIVLFNFNKAVTVKNAMINALKLTGSYIFPPVTLEVWGGTDKTKLKLLGRMNPPVPLKNEAGTIEPYQIDFPAATVNYIKVVAKPIPVLPKWHEGKGQKGWAFLSEVLFN